MERRRDSVGDEEEAETEFGARRKETNKRTKKETKKQRNKHLNKQSINQSIDESNKLSIKSWRN